MKIKKIMFTCVVAALLSALLIPVKAQIQDGGNNTPRADALLGSWRVRIIPQKLPPLDELMTFSTGGGIVESNIFPFFQLGLTAGPGHGTWRYAGRNRFPFIFIK